MRMTFCLTVVALAPLCLAQSTDTVTNQKLLEELKSLRTSIDRLAQLMEANEAAQKADLALRRMQVFESRLATLEGQRARLATQEQQLTKDVSTATGTIRAQDAVVAQGVLKVDGSMDADPQRAALRNRITEGSRSLDETRRKREAADQEIAALRTRIAALEKTLDAALR
jgi:chromosome segregation ATPase